MEEKVYMEILYKLYLFPQVPRLIFLHLWCTGLRISEVCTLKGDAYYWDGEDAWLKVYQIKMKADKMIPIPFMLYMVMRKYIEKNHIRPKDYIFKGKSGGAWELCLFGAAAGCIFLMISKMTRESFGYGDSLLILLLGVVVGFWNLISLLAIAFFLSAVVSAAALVFGKFHRKTTVPFVPFLGIGYFFVRVLGGVG